MSVFIVAEAGVNHLGDRAKMLALCDAAKVSGADAVKFQAYDGPALCKRRGNTDQPSDHSNYTVGELLGLCELSDEDLDAIAAHCKAIGLKWFASVFDPSQIERVLSRGACALKIGHAEADWYGLLQACLNKSVPVYISNASTRSAAYYEIPPDWHVHCIDKYPADGVPPQLDIVGGLPDQRGGFSSHYTDYRIPAAAALRGAEYIEAHLMLGGYWERPKTLEPTWYGHDATDEPEADWSLSPTNFGKMVKLIREYETWL